ncbi:MAG: ATP-dependent helicase HrpB [Polyangiaceae bacterium]|nr:ATP-dependent helicase HrpB [Polyangiaceae bacterium]
MEPLPIDSAIPAILKAFERSGAVVVSAAPGAGKTTRVPRALLDVVPPGKKIIVLEPRRIAAKMAALRVAEELGQRVGQTVGYSMRFEEQVGPETRLVFMTEGVLTRRLLRDPTLADVGAVVLDEVHERHLEGDLALALLLHLRASKKTSVPLVVMSATLNAEQFRARIEGETVHSEGRMFDVNIEHERSDGRELPLRVVSAVRRLIDEGPPGDILVFVPGAAEIRGTMDALGPISRTADLLVLPLHGSLSIEEQTRAVKKADRRKVVVSTNVAESSLTIDGVVGVIDSGLANVASSSPWTGFPLLRKLPVSKASATQRTGRAGRTAPGRCLRLYTKGDFESRPEYDLPEISRADLSFAVLLLAAAGVHNPAALPWLDAPPPSQLAAAFDLLGWLGALDADKSITAVGRRMLDYPLHPRLSRVMVEAEAQGCAAEGAAIAALLSERDLIASSFGDDGRRSASALGRDGTTSDVLTALEAFRASEGTARGARAGGLSPARVAAAVRAEQQIRAVARGRGRFGARAEPAPQNAPDPDAALRLALLTGFADRVGRLRRPSNDTRRADREIVFAGGGSAALAPESGVDGVDLVIAVDAEERSVGRGPRLVVRSASAIEADWLLERYIDHIDDRMDVVWNAATQRADVMRRLMFQELVLEEKPAKLEGAALALASQALATAARAQGWRSFVGEHDLDLFLMRLRFARSACPDANLPEIAEPQIEAALADLCEGRRSFEELKKADLAAHVRGLFSSAEARKLAEIAPETVTLPGGRKAKVNYEKEAPPWVESRLQDFFGMRTGPAAAMGRVPLVLHLLAPNFRAVQVTTDLAGFWERHYPAIARELRRKYPRHAWPDDPLTASPPQGGRIR